MTHICSCEHPLFVTLTGIGGYEDKLECLAIPVQVIEEMGGDIQKALMIDSRIVRVFDERGIEGSKIGGDSHKTDHHEIEYLLIPFEIIDSEKGMKALEEAGIKIPDMELMDHEMIGSTTGIIGTYMGVIWKEPAKDEMTGKLIDHLKPYDVRGHIVYTGCDISLVHKEMDRFGKEILQCSEKGIYIVLHPLDEWTSHHMVELKNGKIV